MRLVNLTPHTLTIVQRGGTKLEVPSSGIVVRVGTTTETVVDSLDFPCPVVKTVFGEVEGMPSREEGTMYVVSRIVKEALGPERSDVVCPDTGPSAVRDEGGRITAVKQLTY